MSVHVVTSDAVIVVPYRSFQYTIVENLGMCVKVDGDLRIFFNTLFYVQIALCSVGIVGSAMAVAVFVKRKLRSSCCVQLACLSLYDIIFLVVCLLIAALGLNNAWGSSAAKVMMCIRNLALWGVAYTTLDICFERCLSVALPFLTHSRFTVGLALKRAIIIVVLGLAFTLPFLLDLIYGYSVGEGCSRKRELTTFGLVYTLYISLILLFLLPFTAIIVINIIFAVLLCRLRHKSVRPKAGENERGQRQLSVLVLGLSGWYVVSMLLPSLLFLVRLTRLELFRPQVDIRAAAVADTVVVLSCCSNFLFYFLLWRPFRQVVWGWMGRGWRRMYGGCESARKRAGTYRTRFTTSTTINGNIAQPVARISFASHVQESSH